MNEQNNLPSGSILRCWSKHYLNVSSDQFFHNSDIEEVHLVFQGHPSHFKATKTKQINIIAMSHDRHGVSNYRSIESLLNSLFRLTESPYY